MLSRRNFFTRTIGALMSVPLVRRLAPVAKPIELIPGTLEQTLTAQAVEGEALWQKLTVGIAMQSAQKAGDVVEVDLGRCGMARVEAGAPIAIGQFLKASDRGRVIPVQSFADEDKIYFDDDDCIE
jgi:hypothetical protein